MSIITHVIKNVMVAFEWWANLQVNNKHVDNERDVCSPLEWKHQQLIIAQYRLDSGDNSHHVACHMSFCLMHNLGLYGQFDLVVITSAKSLHVLYGS